MRRWELYFCAVVSLVSTVASAQQSSKPAMLQWFEVSQKTWEKRTPDLFNVGYGGVWIPPQGRTVGGFSVGYDPYDRFDMGKPLDPTLYGTETGLRSAIKSMQRGGSDVILDFLLNHAGSRDISAMDGPIRFAPNPSNPSQLHGGGYPGFALSLPGSIDGDFHSAFVGDPGSNPNYDYQYRLAGLIDIDHRTNHLFIRNPVTVGDPMNIPYPANATAFGRQANIPNPNNARFYQDRDLPGTALTDPRTGGSYTLYNFNSTTPLAGDAVPENAMGLLMRHAQWMVQEFGIDGFRLDATKHVYPFVLDYYDKSVYRTSKRINLDGSQHQVYSFQEFHNGDKSRIQSVIRKDLVPGSNTVGGIRDALDFPLYFAMKDNLSSNGGSNNWHNIRNASQDTQDDNQRNGSQGVSFVVSHDDGGMHLDNVAYAYTLMRPNDAIVYHTGREFGDASARPFPKDGRGDALGGFYGNTITTLVNLRNTHGRGDFQERWIDDAFNPNGFSNIYIYERSNSAIVALHSGFGTGNDLRSGVQTNFAPGAHLVELTGNAADPVVDPSGQIPEAITVDSTGKVNIRVPHNASHNRGYVIYGLQNPKGAISLTNVAQTLAGATPSAANNGTALLASVDVITANSFAVNLNTTAVTLPDSFRDYAADGDRAYVKIDEGIELNGTGTVDFRTPGSTRYGFENFTTLNDPGWDAVPANSGNGAYSQTINAAQLSEGYHYITARAFRYRPATGPDAGPDIFTDFKKTIYVDRLKPVSAYDSHVVTTGNNRQVRIKSLDLTADVVHTFLNLPAATTEAQILALVSGSNRATQIDRDLFQSNQITSVPNGNNVVTVVTYEITGNYSVQRLPGINMNTAFGAGLGDTNFSGTYTTSDVTLFETFNNSQNTQFNAAGDLNADGLVDNRDLFMLRGRMTTVGASAAVITEARNAELRRGNLNGDGSTNSLDIDFLYTRFGNTAWLYDLDVDGWPTPSGADQQDVDVLVRTIFQTQYGDANLDGQINLTDFNILAGNFGIGAGWGQADFNGDGTVNLTDFNMLAGNFGFMTGDPLPTLDSLILQAASNGVLLPEPASMLWVLSVGLLLSRRRARSFNSTAPQYHLPFGGLT